LGGSEVLHEDRLGKGGDCESTEGVLADPARVRAACESFRGMTSAVSGGEPEVTQACLRPCPTDALPLLGGVPGVEGAYLCTGHNCWGILWGPVSGLAISELVLEGKSTCADISAFTVERFMPKLENRGRRKNEAAVGEKW